MDSPKFSAFNITSTAYKYINEEEIPAWVFIPKDVHTGKRPLLIHLHGGWLITGSGIFADWTSQWSLEYSLQHSAIYIAPNYRLLPESSGLDILSDLSSFWSWIQHDLQAYLRRVGSDVTADLDHILVYGESAGGYLAIQSTLTQRHLLKAAVAAFPMTYLDDAWFCEAASTKSPFGAPRVPRSVLDEHVAAMKKGSVCTGALPPERMPLCLVGVQQGLITVMVGEDDSLFLDRVVRKVGAGEKVPFVFVYHGMQDSAIPWTQSKRFVEEWRDRFGEDSVASAFVPGDHGFDAGCTLETEWLQNGLQRVTKAWLG